MARVSQMQGVSAQIEYLKSDGKRRHPSRCVFADGKKGNRICTCPQCAYYKNHCRSASHCDFYEEKS